MQGIEEHINASIRPASHKLQLHKRNFNTEDIIEQILVADKDNQIDTVECCKYVKGNTITETCINLFNLHKNNIAFIEDPTGVQLVRYPAQLWHDKHGDCKSFAISITSYLKNLGIPCFYRFISETNSKPVHHVYACAVIDNKGTYIVIDPTIQSGNFNDELDFAHHIDYEATPNSLTAVAQVNAQHTTATPTQLMPVNFSMLTPQQFESITEQMLSKGHYTNAKLFAEKYYNQSQFAPAINASIGSWETFKKNLAGKLSPRLRNTIEQAIQDLCTKGAPFFLYLFWPESSRFQQEVILPPTAEKKLAQALDLIVETEDLFDYSKIDRDFIKEIKLVRGLFNVAIASNDLAARKKAYTYWFTYWNVAGPFTKKPYKSNKFFTKIRLSLIGTYKADPGKFIDAAFEQEQLQLFNLFGEVLSIQGKAAMLIHVGSNDRVNGNNQKVTDYKIIADGTKYKPGTKIYVAIGIYTSNEQVLLNGAARVQQVVTNTADLAKLLGGSRLDYAGKALVVLTTNYAPTATKECIGSIALNSVASVGVTPRKFVVDANGGLRPSINSYQYFDNSTVYNENRIGIDPVTLSIIITTVVAVISAVLKLVADLVGRKNQAPGASAIPQPPCDFGYPYETEGGNWVSCGRALGVDNSTKPVLVDANGTILQQLDPANLPPPISEKPKTAILGWLVALGLVGAAAYGLNTEEDTKNTKAKVNGYSL